MTDQTDNIAIPKEMSTLERIQLLGNLANSVQNEAIKSAFVSIPAGDQLYDIFVTAVSKEIESMMSPSKAAPKELVDTLTVANHLKNQISYMYQAMAELSRTQLIGVLNVLNTSLGGRPLPANPQNDAPMSQEVANNQQQAPRQQQQPRPQNDDQSSKPVVRQSNNGITW